MLTDQQAIKQQFYEQNNKRLKQSTDDDTKLDDFLQFLIKEYPYGERKMNLGSFYQIPIFSKGVELFTKYCIWNIEMLNITMHKVDDQGLQHIIKRMILANQNKQIQPWNQLSQLSMIRNTITSDGFKDIEKCDLSNFKILRASNNNIDYTGIDKFIQCKWPNFKELYLSNNKIGKQGCKLLMKSKWKNFQRLDLNFNFIGNQGVHYLCQADWPQLLEINIANCRITAQATYYLAGANWPKLQIFILNKNQIGKFKGKLSQVGCLNLSRMKSNCIDRLFIYGNQIYLNGVKLIIRSTNFAHKCYLQLSRNHFKYAEIQELLKINDKFCNQYDS